MTEKITYGNPADREWRAAQVFTYFSAHQLAAGAPCQNTAASHFIPRLLQIECGGRTILQLRHA